MNAAVQQAVASVRISQVWAELGGGPLRNGRGKAFWRNGDGANVSINDQKNTWHDFARNTGGGVLTLIQVVQRCDRKAALRWFLETFSLDVALDRPLTPAECRRFERARAEAERFLAWRIRRLEELRERRDFCLGCYHSALQLIVAHGLNHPLGSIWADGCEAHEERYLGLDVEIAHFKVATTAELLPFFREHERRTE